MLVILADGNELWIITRIFGVRRAVTRRGLSSFSGWRFLASRGRSHVGTTAACSNSDIGELANKSAPLLCDGHTPHHICLFTVHVAVLPVCPQSEYPSHENLSFGF